ncbi:MAG: NYN domain-containing protein [Parachlamydiaceae bacterium]|nr:NYN domain-containing protein [Parachlamydiaceae bacterium]
MHYFIDGYNLMFRVSRAEGVLQKRREEIIQDLEVKINALDLNVTLVFDSQYQNSESSRSHILRLEVLFTNVGETADEFILQALKEDTRPNLQTVVTCDKKLAWLARRRHAHTETVEEFISFLNRRYKNKLQPKKIPLKLIPSIVPKKLSTTPDLSKSSPEDCFDFYLNQFQSSYTSLVEEKNSKKEAKKLKAGASSSTKKKRKATAAPKADDPSIMQRWLTAFHRDIDEDEKLNHF